MLHHGQGAISSFEDAVALAHILNDDATISLTGGLERYEQERKKRGEKIQKSSRRLNDCLHLPAGQDRAERNAVLNSLEQHFSWLHSYQIGV